MQNAKKISIFLILVLSISGCATYKFHLGEAPYDTGYVVSRENRAILEYTIGEDNTVPDLELAKERFKRRRQIVEHYYKKMGYISNNFKKNFWESFAMFAGVIGGVFRLPFVAVSDYRYEHDPEYKEDMDRLEQEKEAQEETRLKKLKDELNNYIRQDLTRENP